MVAKDNAKSVVKDLAKVSKTKGEDAAAMVGLLQDVRGTTSRTTSRNQTNARFITERVN